MAFEFMIFGAGPETAPGVRRWLDQPLSRATKTLTLVGAITLMALLAWAVGGPELGDASLSVYTTWLLAHANLACAYPAGIASPHAYVSSVLTSPLYPIFAALLVDLLHIGQSVPFPSATALGHACQNTLPALDAWASRTNALTRTEWLGISTWVALFTSLFTFLNVRGEFTRRNALALFVAGLGAPVYLALMIYFHPQDLLAIAFIVFALASVRCNRWFTAGLTIGFGLLTQQFVVLAAIPLLVACPRNRLSRFILGAFMGFVPIALSLLILTNGSALLPIILGSDRVIPGSGSGVISHGGTWLWELHLHGTSAFVLSRVMPLAMSLLISVWGSRKWDVRNRPESMVALVGLSLSMRLVFEQNLFSYYFAAVFVALILVGVSLVSRVDFIALWVALDFIGFETMQHIGSLWSLPITPSEERIPAWLLTIILLALILVNLRDRRIILYQPVLLVGVVAMSHTLLWGRDALIAFVPYWILQLLLVPSAIAIFVNALGSSRTPPQPDNSAPILAREVQG